MILAKNLEVSVSNYINIPTNLKGQHPDVGVAPELNDHDFKSWRSVGSSAHDSTFFVGDVDHARSTPSNDTSFGALLW